MIMTNLKNTSSWKSKPTSRPLNFKASIEVQNKWRRQELALTTNNKNYTAYRGIWKKSNYTDQHQWQQTTWPTWSPLNSKVKIGLEKKIEDNKVHLQDDKEQKKNKEHEDNEEHNR